MVYKSSTHGGGGGTAGVSSLQGETGDITITSSGGSVTITTPSANEINLEAAGGGTVTTTGTPAANSLARFSGPTSITNGDLLGDVTTSGGMTATLATVNSNVGSFGSGVSIPVITVNAKGLLTAVGTTAVAALSTVLTNAHIFVGNGSNVATDVAMVGDATLTSNGSITLATVNSNIGSFGSNVSIPTFTVNAKGLLTAAGTTNVVASAGTLIGTRIGSTVVSSSLTQIGTIATGTWQATTIDVPYGGTGLTTVTANAVVLGRATASLGVATIGTAGRAFVDQGAATDPAFRAIVGDATLTANGSITLATVNSNIGSFGSGVSIPTFTVNAKGLLTAAGTAQISTFTASIAGVTPASGGGTTNFLRADGTWQAPAGGGTVTSVGLVTTGSGIVTTGGSITGAGTFTQAISAIQTIWVPAAAIRPSSSGGCAALGLVATGANLPDISSLNFDPSTPEYAQFSVRFPKGWDEGTITADFHWTANTGTTNAVVWGIQAIAVGDNDAIGTAFGDFQHVTDANGASPYTERITAQTGALTIAGTPAAGDRCAFRLYRSATASGDTLTIDANLLGVDLFFNINTLDDT